MPRFSPKIQRVTMLTRMTFNFSRHLLSVCGKMGFAGRRSAQIKLLSNIPMLVWIRSSTVLKISKAVPGLSRSAFKVFTRGILHLLSQETKGELRVIFSLEPHQFISAEPLTCNAYSTKCVRFAALLCSKCLKTRAVPEAMHKNRAGYTSDQAKKDQFLGKEGLFGSPLRGGRGRGRKGRTAHEGAVRERVQRRMSHLQALAWVAREAPPPPKRLLLSLFHCLAALRLCGDPWLWARRGTVAVPQRGKGRAGKHSPSSGHVTALPARCAISGCQRTGTGLWVSLTPSCFM